MWFLNKKGLLNKRTKNLLARQGKQSKARRKKETPTPSKKRHETEALMEGQFKHTRATQLRTIKGRADNKVQVIDMRKGARGTRGSHDKTSK